MSSKTDTIFYIYYHIQVHKFAYQILYLLNILIFCSSLDLKELLNVENLR